MVSAFICVLLLCSGICAYGCAGETNVNAVKSAWGWHGEDLVRSNHSDEITSRVSVRCKICNWILNKVKKSIGPTNITKKIINEKLKGICKYALNFKKRCLDFVARNKDKLTNAFVKLRNPKQACISLGFCKTSLANGKE